MEKYTIAATYANIQPVPSSEKYAKGAKYGKRESRNSVEDQFWFYVESVICKQPLIMG